jgi:hypothetical protein
VVEPQLHRDDKKHRAWAHYTLSLAARYRRPVQVIVVTLDDDVARWAKQTITIEAGLQYQPLVIEPASLPIIDDAESARRDPELAVLSALAHRGSDHSPAIVRAALAGIDHLDPLAAAIFHDMLRASQPLLAASILEELMTIPAYEFQSDFAKTHLAAGRAEECRRNLLSVLEARGFSVDATALARIAETGDVEQLEGWLKRAVTAADLAEVFGG